MIAKGERRLVRVPNAPFHSATLLVESLGPVFDNDGRYRHTAWIVVQGSTCSRFWMPGTRGVFDEADLLPVE
jgi:hypothetical protein